MPFAGVGGTSVRESQYLIDNSLRFNRSDESRLTRTPSSSNRKTFTLSSWVKRSAVNVSYEQILYEVRPSAGTYFNVSFRNTGSPADDELLIGSSAGSFNISLEGVFRDVSAWYHIVLAFDTTQATSSDRIKFYVNGNQVSTGYYTTYPAQNTDLIWNTNNEHRVGGSGFSPSTDSSNFYLAEIHHIDGQQLSPTDFGEYDDSGIWKPIEYTGTYGTNGFYFQFQNTADAGEDSSGNGNNFTGTGMGASDHVTDTPTNNFATFNAVFRNNTTNFTQPATLSEGNLRATGVNTEGNISTIGLNAGKWYWEAKIVTRISNDLNFNILSIAGGGGAVFRSVTWQSQGDLYIDDSLYDTSFTTFSSGDIIACALDLDAATPAFKLYKNGAEQGSGFTFNASGRDDNGASIFIGVGIENTSDDAQYNFGNPTFTISSGNSDGNGYGNFEYAPPSGYLALCTQNLTTALSPTIDDGSQYFNTVLYTGNGSTNNITGVGFQPDWVWGKCRSAAQQHRLFDSSRGVLKNLISSATNAEATTANSLTSFDSDGFTLGSDDNLNFNTRTFVAWNWKANGGTTSSNTDGSITSTVQADTTAGFSIVTYTGTGSDGSVGHGLGVAPKFYIIKSRNVSNGWIVGHTALGTSTYPYNLILNSSNAKEGGSYDDYLTADPTSTVLNLGNAGNVNGSGNTYVAYCFAEIEGYSKFGSYTGNGNADGTFVYTGFRPAWIMWKRTDSSTGGEWVIQDTTRRTFNPVNVSLYPNLSNAEATGETFRVQDTLSNGFKVRSSASQINASGGTYIYVAFAENPFVSSSAIPVVAR